MIPRVAKVPSIVNPVIWSCPSRACRPASKARAAAASPGRSHDGTTPRGPNSGSKPATFCHFLWVSYGCLTQAKLRRRCSCVQQPRRQRRCHRVGRGMAYRPPETRLSGVQLKQRKERNAKHAKGLRETLWCLTRSSRGFAPLGVMTAKWQKHCHFVPLSM
jgi:hypothetical protein